MPIKMKWYLRPMFAEENPVCRAVWALCAIASDLRFEVKSMRTDLGEESVESLHHRLYFFRGNLRSLFSAQKLLNQLRADATFNSMAQRHGELDAFELHRRVVAQCATEFIGYRNRFAAHTETDVGDGLKMLAADASLVLDEHQSLDLARHIGMLAFLAAIRAELKVPPERETAALLEMLSRMGVAVIACLKCINVVVAVLHREFGVDPSLASDE